MNEKIERGEMKTNQIIEALEYVKNHAEYDTGSEGADRIIISSKFAWPKLLKALSALKSGEKVVVDGEKLEQLIRMDIDSTRPRMHTIPEDQIVSMVKMRLADLQGGQQ